MTRVAAAIPVAGMAAASASAREGLSFGPSLSWSASAPVEREFVVVSDALEPDGEFLVAQLVAFSLLAERPVVLLSTTTSEAHFLSILRKLGVPSGALRGLAVRPLISEEDAELTWDGLLERVRAALPVPSAAGSLVVLDNATALADVLAGEAEALVERLLQSLVGLIGVAGSGVEALVVRVHGDLPSSSLASWAHRHADVALTLRPLASGHSRDVHGSLLAERRRPRAVVAKSGGLERAGDVLVAPATEAHFKVLDSGLRFHRVGELRV